MLTALDELIHAIVLPQEPFDQGGRVTELSLWYHAQFREELGRNNQALHVRRLHPEILVFALQDLVS